MTAGGQAQQDEGAPHVLSRIDRRQALLSLLSGAVAFARQNASRLSVEGYIFQQYATRQKKKLAEVLDEVFEMARAAGFHNVEINQAFFIPEIRDRALELLRTKQLRMPSVYVGGAMHTPEAAEATTAKALEIGRLCRPFGCVGVVNNPDPKPAGAAKSEEELTVQSAALNRLGQALKEDGFELRVHHHTPELLENAREWRHILHNTDAQFVALCIDIDWVHQGGFEPLALLREAGGRVQEIHVRNSKDKLWLEKLEDGDVDYRAIAGYLRGAQLQPLLVVELAYRENTSISRPLGEDLRLSRIYAERVFGLRA